MLKIENVVLPNSEQWKAMIRGMRNPKNSWDRSDSGEFGNPFSDEGKCGGYSIGPNDAKLMTRLAKGGPVHAKYKRMIPVFLDITAPLYWWKEFDTYKIGTVANSCSTMHKIHDKEFTLDDFSHEHLTCYGAPTRRNENSSIDDEQMWELDFDYMGALLGTIKALNGARERYLKHNDKQMWWQMIQLLPSSYNQKRTVMLNYEVLTNIYHSRKNHKLDEWHTLCDWIETLPVNAIIIGEFTGLEE